MVDECKSKFPFLSVHMIANYFTNFLYHYYLIFYFSSNHTSSTTQRLRPPREPRDVIRTVSYTHLHIEGYDILRQKVRTADTNKSTIKLRTGPICRLTEKKIKS